MEDGHARPPCDVEQRGRVYRRPLDQLRAAEDEARVGEGVLEIDDEDGRPFARFDPTLAVAASDPGVIGVQLERDGNSSFAP
jgi:hypothetical protein